MNDEIEVHFNTLGLSGATLVVVVIGAEVYGAADVVPVTALHAAARRASEDFAQRGQSLDANLVIERGHEELKARARRSSPAGLRIPSPDGRPR